jgi:hypothetical protein
MSKIVNKQTILLTTLNMQECILAESIIITPSNGIDTSIQTSLPQTQTTTTASTEIIVTTIATSTTTTTNTATTTTLSVSNISTKITTIETTTTVTTTTTTTTITTIATSTTTTTLSNISNSITTTSELTGIIETKSTNQIFDITSSKISVTGANYTANFTYNKWTIVKCVFYKYKNNGSEMIFQNKEIINNTNLCNRMDPEYQKAIIEEKNKARDQLIKKIEEKTSNEIKRVNEEYKKEIIANKSFGYIAIISIAVLVSFVFIMDFTKFCSSKIILLK